MSEVSEADIRRPERALGMIGALGHGFVLTDFALYAGTLLVLIFPPLAQQVFIYFRF